MRNVFVLACLVARAAAADPSISTADGNVVIVAEDLHFTRSNASGGAEIDISLIEIASRIDTLASQLAAVTTDVASNTFSVGTLTTDVASNTAGVASNTRSVGTLTTDVASNTAGVASITRSVTRSVGTLTAGVASNTLSVGTLTTAVASNTAEICSVQKFEASTFEYKGINSRRGKQATAQISGNSRQYKSVSSNSNPDDIFDGWTGRWGSSGATYRGERNNNGGGMEVRFETPVHIASWIVRCIRSSGSGQGQTCYGNGGYDFTYIEVDYWASNRWNRAGTLNARNTGDWHSDYAGSLANARSQNWRFWIPQRNPRNQPQHGNRNTQVHVSEIEIFGC